MIKMAQSTFSIEKSGCATQTLNSLNIYFFLELEFCHLGSTREGYHVAYVLHAGDKEY